MTRTAIAAAATIAGAATLVAWLRHHFVVIDVYGPSMQPTLYAGDRVLVRRRPLRRIRAGDVVVIENLGPSRTSRHPAAAASGRRNLSGHAWIIKRAVAVPGDPVPASVAAAVSEATGAPVPDGYLIVLGDNATHSIDSRHYGYLSGRGVLGAVVRQRRPSDGEHRTANTGTAARAGRS